MSESTQIVRRLRKGEFPPAYSTDELLRGVCHVVHRPRIARYVAPPAVKAPPKPNNGSHKDQFLKYRDLIKPLLIAGHNNRAIASRLKIDDATLPRYISRDAELRQLSLARTHLSKRGRSVGDSSYEQIKDWIISRISFAQIAENLAVTERVIRKYVYGVPELRELSYLAFGTKKEFDNGLKSASSERYALYRDEIKKALAEEPLTQVRNRFGFGYNTLKRHLAEDEVKNGK